jgi:hypothetical protein
VRVARPTVPKILLPFKITVKGAPSGRVYDGAQTAPPLTLIFHGKPIGTYQVERGFRRPPVVTVKSELTVNGPETDPG